jgi:hypothetical protein
MRTIGGFFPLPAVVLLLSLALVGCHKDQVSKSNYDQIQIGTSYADAEKLMGGPGERAGTRVVGELRGGKPLIAQSYRWKSGGAVVEIEFSQGKVSKKTAFGL